MSITDEVIIIMCAHKIYSILTLLLWWTNIRTGFRTYAITNNLRLKKSCTSLLHKIEIWMRLFRQLCDLQQCEQNIMAAGIYACATYAMCMITFHSNGNCHYHYIRWLGSIEVLISMAHNRSVISPIHFIIV